MPQQPTHDRWIALGGLGWINLVESLIRAGVVMQGAYLDDLRGVHGRLGALLGRIDAKAYESDAVAPDPNRVNTVDGSQPPAAASGAEPRFRFKRH